MDPSKQPTTKCMYSEPTPKPYNNHTQELCPKQALVGRRKVAVSQNIHRLWKGSACNKTRVSVRPGECSRGEG